MSFNELAIPGVFLINNFNATDNRGVFVKTFNKNLFEQIGFNGNFTESYYSTSEKNVIRGMHFQLPPHEHEKLVYVTDGVIVDVVLDLRIKSPTYGKSISVELEAFGKSIFIPKGCAHGFLAKSDNATVVYNVTTVYNKEADMGILWNSFNFEWGILNPILSVRDNSFEAFTNFKSPF